MRRLPTLLASVVLAGGLAGCGTAPVPEPPPLPASSPYPPPPPPPPPGTGDITRAEFPWPLHLSDAEDILLKTTLFEFGGMRRQVHAFNVIFDQPDALERFRRVARLAGPAGRLYALCGLQELFPYEAVSLGRTLAESSDRIMVGRSDVYGEESIRDMVVAVLAERLGAEFRRSRMEVEKHFKGPG